MFKKMYNKGQAGMNIFLSIIAMLFVIGIIVMAFQLTGAKLMATDGAFDTTGNIAVTNESHYMNGSIDYFDLTYSTLRSVVCSVTSINNGSVVIGAGNYSVSNCRITQTTTTYENQTWKTTYSYNYEAPNEASRVINETKVAIGESTSWFGIFITISAVVVLILLIVLIIMSLKGAGLMGNGGEGA